MTVIHELNTPIEVFCKKHGWGMAIMVIDYGYNINTVWIVRLQGGMVKHFLSEDIRMGENPMAGAEIIIPSDW